MGSHRKRSPRPTAAVSDATTVLAVTSSATVPVDKAPTPDGATQHGIGQDGALVQAAPTVRIRTIFRRFWPDTQGFRGRVVCSLLLVAVPPALAAAAIYLFKILVDDVLTTRDVARFPLVAAAFVGITLLEGLVSFIDAYLNAWVAERFVLNLRSRVFDHLQRLSLSFFQKHQLGDILARLTGDVGAVEQLLLSGVNQALTYIFQIIFFGGALFFLDWRLALAALVGAPAFLLLARFFARRIKEASRERRRRSGSITAVAEESLHNAALVQAYHREAHESARFRRENLGSFTAQMLATKLEALFRPFSDLLEAIGVLLVIGFGLRELIAGRITLGGLLVFIGYLTQLYGPITGFGSLTNAIFAASAGAERIIEVLDTEPEVRDPANPVSMRGRAQGAVRVDRVSFRYPDSGRPALDDVSFTAAPGETIAVVGASGAGKSTLLRILLRLHDPADGAVSLDRVDLRRLRLGELRGNIAAVLQETLVFDGTVAENIRWGKPDATEEEVLRAAQAADAHHFITGMPGGYNARIGQRGMMLSGGQRQRIALARAMIRDAPVLLLDEPTTGLDAASTQRVMAPLRRAMAGRTTIVISHNLLTVTDADRILYLERGRVAGYGPHRELLATSPGYAELYRLHHPGPGPVAPAGLRPELAARPRSRPEPTLPPFRPDSARPPGRPAPGSRPDPRGITAAPGTAAALPAPLARPRPTGHPTPNPGPTTGPRKPPARPTSRPVPTAGPASVDNLRSIPLLPSPPPAPPQPTAQPAANGRPTAEPVNADDPTSAIPVASAPPRPSANPASSANSVPSTANPVPSARPTPTAKPTAIGPLGKPVPPAKPAPTGEPNPTGGHPTLMPRPVPIPRGIPTPRPMPIPRSVSSSHPTSSRQAWPLPSSLPAPLPVPVPIPRPRAASGGQQRPSTSPPSWRSPRGTTDQPGNRPEPTDD